MNSSTRTILVMLPVLALTAAMWLLLVGPKRERASELESKAVDLRAQVEEQEQIAASAETAREDFPRAYRRLLVLGKAAPSDDDTSSLLVQLSRIAERTEVDFRGLEASEGTGAPAPPPPSPEGEEAAPAETAQPTSATPGAAPATEASAALLPIGASVGPAGLPVMKYELSFQGDFFRLADFVAGVDGLVRLSDDGRVGVSGRLITIDGFELAAAEEETGPSPTLDATFTITTFLTPAEEGETGGATPAGPSPAETQAASTPATEPGSTTASTVAP